jgi:hypothetical protein
MQIVPRLSASAFAGLAALLHIPAECGAGKDAWILEPGANGKPAGLASKSELREEEVRAIMSEWRKSED